MSSFHRLAPEHRRRVLGGLGLTFALCLLWIVASAWWRGPEVEVVEVREGPLELRLVTTARVSSPSRIGIGSEIPGTVVERRVREGDRVRRGAVLIRLRDDDARARLGEAEAALAQFLERDRPATEAQAREAEARYAQAQRSAERARRLAAQGLVPNEQLELAEQSLAVALAQVQRARVLVRAGAPNGAEERLLRARVGLARAQLQRTELRAPVDGLVLRRAVEPGDVVVPGQVLLELAADAAVELVAAVDERNLAALAEGQLAWAAADAYPERRFVVRVAHIAPMIDPGSGAAEVRFEVPDPPAELRYDMTVSVDIELARRERALLLPADALRAVRGDRAEILLLRDGRVHQAEVRIGLRGLGEIEVLSGLVVGDTVLPASSMLQPGARARAVTSGSVR